jgi:GABA permease
VEDFKTGWFAYAPGMFQLKTKELGMTWKTNILVVANVTATSDELVQAMKARAVGEAVSFMLLIPATPFGGGRAAAQENLTQACERLRTEGLDVDGAVGDGDPLVAVTEAWDPKRYDEIILATLPMRFSKWLHAGLPERIERLTGAPVSHVIAQPKQEIEVVPAPTHERAAMGPLTVLGWGGPHEEG